MFKPACALAILALAVPCVGAAAEPVPDPASTANVATVRASGITDVTGSYDTDEHGSKHYRGAVTFVSSGDVMSGTVRAFVVDPSGSVTVTAEAMCLVPLGANEHAADLPSDVLRSRCRLPQTATSVLYTVRQQVGQGARSRVTVESDLPAPQCARPNVPPAVVHAVSPDMPLAAVQQRISGDVQIIVSLDAFSNVVATRIVRSDNPLLAEAAVSAARGSTYRTRIRDCVPVPSEYMFVMTFAP